MPPVIAQPAQFTLLLFGIFRLCVGDTPVPLRGRKACALLAYLALVQMHRASREQIAALLWTDRGTEQARASLRQTLAELRAIAGVESALAIGRHEIALLPDAFASDLGRVLAACAASDLSALARALDAIQGSLLESFGDVSPGFDEWLAIERTARTEELVANSLACVEGHGVSHPDETHAVLRALDRLDPFNEGVARMGMRLDHAAGDNAALHRRYRRLADQLQGEFGVSPAEATRSLFQELTRGHAPEAHRPAAAAPRPAPPPAGFADDLVPAVVVAPLQLVGEPGLTPEQADFCSDDMRLAVGSLQGIKVLAADADDIPGLLAGSADALALYLLSGKIRDPGTGPVAMMQLANARDRTILWSESIRLDDKPDPVDAVVTRAVGALQPAIDRDLERMMHASALESADERAQFVSARLAIRRAADLGETLRGVEALEAIVAKNPRHLGAHLLLGRMYNTDFWQQMTGHDVAALRRRAAAHLEAAASVAPQRVDVRVRRAWVMLRQGHFGAAAKDFDAVLAERQLDPDILNQVAFGLCHLGDLDRATAVMQRAFELNPFAPSDYHADYAVILALAGEAASAEEHFLVSGETGLQYNAVRIANFAALAPLPHYAADIEQHFAGSFVAAWQGKHSPQPADVLSWIGHTLPLCKRAHAAFVSGGLEQRLPEFWPASSDSDRSEEEAGAGARRASAPPRPDARREERNPGA